MNKRENTLRQGLECVTIIESAIEWLEDKVKADIPEHYGHSVMLPVTTYMKRHNESIRSSLERQLGRCLAEPEPGLFERLLKAKCDRKSS